MVECVLLQHSESSQQVNDMTVLCTSATNNKPDDGMHELSSSVSKSFAV